MERRLEKAARGYMTGHVKPPGDRMLGLAEELGVLAEEEALVQGAEEATAQAHVEAEGGEVRSRVRVVSRCIASHQVRGHHFNHVM